MALPIIDENQAIYYVRWNAENVAIGAAREAAREIIDLLTGVQRPCKVCAESHRDEDG